MLFVAVSVLSAASYVSPSEVSTVDAVRFNKNTHRYETLCSVHYYMSGDTVFVDKQYSFLGVQFSDNATKGIVQEKAFLFNKKGNLWYAVITKEKAKWIAECFDVISMEDFDRQWILCKILCRYHKSIKFSTLYKIINPIYNIYFDVRFAIRTLVKG